MHYLVALIYSHQYDVLQLKYRVSRKMNRTGFNSYKFLIIIFNKLIVRSYTVMIRQMITVQTKFKVP